MHRELVRDRSDLCRDSRARYGGFASGMQGEVLGRSRPLSTPVGQLRDAVLMGSTDIRQATASTGLGRRVGWDLISFDVWTTNNRWSGRW